MTCLVDLYKQKGMGKNPHHMLQTMGLPSLKPSDLANAAIAALLALPRSLPHFMLATKCQRLILTYILNKIIDLGYGFRRGLLLSQFGALPIRGAQGSKLSTLASYQYIFILVTKRYKKGGWTKTYWERKWLVFPGQSMKDVQNYKYPSPTFRYALGRI